MPASAPRFALCAILLLALPASAASFDQAVSRFEQARQADDYQEAVKALNEAARVSDRRVVPWLSGLLLEKDQRYARQAAMALGANGSDGAISALRQVVAGPGNENPRSYAADALLPHIDRCQSGDFRDGLLASKHLGLQTACAKAMVALGSTEALQILVQAVQDVPEAQAANANAAQARLNETIYRELRATPSQDGAELLMEMAAGRAANREQRLLGLRLLGDWAHQPASPLLLKYLKTKDPAFREAACRGLGLIGDESALSALRGRLKDKGPGVPEAAAVAIGRVPGSQSARLLLGMLKERNPVLQITAVRALGERQEPDAFQPILKLLDHDVWQLRSAVIEALRHFRNKEAIPPLIGRLDREQGRLQGEVLDALRDLSGKPGMMPDPLSWQVWWDANKERHVVPEAGSASASKGTVLRDDSYFGIEVRSQRVIFVIDISGSMSAVFPEASQGGRPSTGQHPTSENPYAGQMRLEAVKQELRKLIGHFADGVYFNIIAFNHGERPWQQGLVPANGKNKQAALEWVDALKPGGGTNIYDPLAEAFDDVNVDTIFLLTDGAPGSGTYTDTGRICEEIARLNQVRRIAIHTINFGGVRALLERLARENSGKYVELR